MRLRSTIPLGPFAVVSLLTSTTLCAQRPQTREGFWFSAGLGAGSLSSYCDGCAHQDNFGGAIFARLGGTANRRLLLGVEFNDWLGKSDSSTIDAGYLAFTMYWYTSPTGGFFFKAGSGIAGYSRETGTQHADHTNYAIVMGGGYDIRVARRVSITPELSVWGSGPGDLKDSTTSLQTGFRHGGITLHLGVTFH